MKVCHHQVNLEWQLWCRHQPEVPTKIIMQHKKETYLTSIYLVPVITCIINRFHSFIIPFFSKSKISYSKYRNSETVYITPEFLINYILNRTCMLLRYRLLHVTWGARDNEWHEYLFQARKVSGHKYAFHRNQFSICFDEFSIGI